MLLLTSFARLLLMMFFGFVQISAAHQLCKVGNIFGLENWVGQLFLMAMVVKKQQFSLPVSAREIAQRSVLSASLDD